ncbi:MAG: multidrug effflux MFS transporter [Bacteroidota bacterium]
MEQQHQPRQRIILILGMLMTISPFAIDMYLPAFGQIANDMGTSATRISLSVASYFVGLAFGQLMYGPMLDRFGRKKPLYIGLSMFMAASLGCMQSDSITSLVVFRFFQALGGCVAWVAAATMVRDFFSIRESSKIFSLLILVLGLSPLVAPTAGGFVAVTLGWRAIFLILLILTALILLVVILFLPPARDPDPSVDLRPFPMLRTYLSILREPQFVTYTVSGSLAFAALFTYVSGSPVIFMELYAMEPQHYGLLFAGISVGFIGASQLNILMTRYFRSDRIFNTVLPVQAAIGFIFMIVAFTSHPPAWLTIGFIFLTMACIGMLNPNGSALALAPFTRNIGSASAMAGFMQITLASVVSTVVGSFNSATLLPFALLMGSSSMAGLLVLTIGRQSIRNLVTGEADGVSAH